MTPAEPLVLACDTSSARGSVALARGGVVIGRVALEGEGGHSRRFLAAVAALLLESRAVLRDVDRFAAISGPGSFTGLRVSLAGVRGLAGGKPCAGVVASDVAALAAARAGLGAGRILALTDLFHDEVFGGVYESDGRLGDGSARVAGKIADVVADLRTASVAGGPPEVGVGAGATRHREAVRAAFPSIRFAADALSFDLASPLAAWASLLPEGLRWTSADEVLPFYLRDPLSRALPRVVVP